jgi:hypothetical protein
MTTDSGLEYVGDEDLTVRAGAFRCARFRFVGTSHGYPPYDMWVTTDGHYHFVQAVLAGPRPQRFELVALAETALWPERPERAAAPARVA